MALTLLIGGARAGKSTIAVTLAKTWAGSVTVIATAEPRDAEMTERIARHRAERPAEWETIEEPFALADVLRKLDDDTGVIVDCLTLWTSNLFERGATDEEIDARAREAAAVAAERLAPTIAVTNEVGLGIVPADAPTRRFRDSLGRVNAIFADAAGASHLVVAGRLLPLVEATEVTRDR
jgi:adenosyl cobinamide kinase/adenosyl cobinamide phosphate guanylyltransferase